jgi:hypothetical protein
VFVHREQAVDLFAMEILEQVDLVMDSESGREVGGGGMLGVFDADVTSTCSWWVSNWAPIISM